jgi:hypothetical protein
MINEIETQKSELDKIMWRANWSQVTLDFEMLSVPPKAKVNSNFGWINNLDLNSLMGVAKWLK